MNLRSNFFKMGLLSAAFIVFSFSQASAQDSEFSFKVFNRTDSKIVKLMVAEPGQKKWSFFDIGSGIPAGRSATLIWSKTTDNQSCVQWVKAVYADKSESKPVKFDFCEEDLELEFT
jgi:uncharacterized protein YbdZ (MbtH family)